MSVLPVTNDDTNIRKRFKKKNNMTCVQKSSVFVKKRLPIVEWIPKYNFSKLLQDLVAGITVALTAIPQGMAIAVVANLPPEYGLYAGIMSGFVYCVFGSCKNLTVGPTSILAAIIAKYVSNYSNDFAVLAAFLAGVVELIMGILHLGFLVEFISVPVISGFTTAAALQIASSQFKGLFGTDGPAGNVFYESVFNFFSNITTVKPWDTLLGLTSILLLFFLKWFGKGTSRNGSMANRLKWFISLARNALVVIIGMIIAYAIKVTNKTEPMVLIKDIRKGMPEFKPPPFSTTVGNETLSFVEMLEVLGPQAIVIPLVAILEAMAISKAFSEGKLVDASQEMMALGFCNIIGSFATGMPVTGSFTRTALNYSSGVQTTFGGVVKSLIIISAVSLLTSTFYYIPKASLAALIISAMFSMIDYKIFIKLWKHSKRELFLLVITLIVALTLGLEYGILIGVLFEILTLLYSLVKPAVELTTLEMENSNIMLMKLPAKIAFCAGERIRSMVLEISQDNVSNLIIVVDGSIVKNLDTTVVENLLATTEELEKRSCKIRFLNFNEPISRMCQDFYPKCERLFLTATNIDDLLTEEIK